MNENKFLNTKQQKYNEIFEYSDGLLFWKISTAPCVKIGDVAGSYTKAGYLNIKCQGERAMGHRVIWIMFNGDIPDGFEIDHKDLNRRNNRIENLRLATQYQNGYNRNKTKRNVTGFKGVSLRTDRLIYSVQIRKDGVNKHLGEFKDLKIAAKVYADAAKILHGEFVRT
jgi:hypothetical protein